MVDKIKKNRKRRKVDIFLVENNIIKYNSYLLRRKFISSSMDLFLGQHSPALFPILHLQHYNWWKSLDTEDLY